MEGGGGEGSIDQSRTGVSQKRHGRCVYAISFADITCGVKVMRGGYAGFVALGLLVWWVVLAENAACPVRHKDRGVGTA